MRTALPSIRVKYRDEFHRCASFPESDIAQMRKNVIFCVGQIAIFSLA